MLTKDLIEARLEGTRVRPLLLDTGNPEFLELAQQMLDCFPSEGRTVTRGEVDDALDLLQDGCERLRIFRGLRKTLEDRTEFDPPEELDYPTQRRDLFRLAAQCLRNWDPGQPENLRTALCTGPARDNPLLTTPQSAIYRDLPENDIISRPPQMSARELLERYNIGLVQGLLLQSERLEVELESPSASRLRRLLGLVRFHRLLAEIHECPPSTLNGEKRNALKLSIDGPGSVLEQSKGYGLQLALFFPAICGMERWKMRAKVFWKNNLRSLVLDECSGLVSHLSSGAYVPPEVTMFQQAFRENENGWELLDECPHLKAKGGILVIPDFAFRAPSGRIVFLELFHRWHANQLLTRLEQLENGADWPLVLGVDRAVAARPDIQERLASTTADSHLFLYRDFPTIPKVLKALEAEEKLDTPH